MGCKYAQAWSFARIDNTASVPMRAHFPRTVQQRGAAVEDTEGDLRMGTMTLVTCYGDRLLTSLANRLISHHAGRGGSGGNMASLSSTPCSLRMCLDQQNSLPGHLTIFEKKLLLAI